MNILKGIPTAIFMPISKESNSLRLLTWTCNTSFAAVSHRQDKNESIHYRDTLSNILNAGPQIRGASGDNSEIIFLISQHTYML